MAKGYEVTANEVNIRSGPGGQYETIDTAKKGEVLVSPAGWVPVELEDGTVGWLSAKYVKATEIEDEVAPVVSSIVTGKQIVAKAMTQAGDAYIFGHEVNLDDPDPKAFDCSELVQWVCHQLKVKPEMPDGAANQCDHCRKYGFLISISEAVDTPGALLFRISPEGNHVVISRGDGTTIEAKGSAYGTGVFAINGRGWTHAGLIPGVKYT